VSRETQDWDGERYDQLADVRLNIAARR